MTSRKQLIEFSLEMGRRTRATVRQCEALLRYAGSLAHLAEVERVRELNMTEVRKRARLRGEVNRVCADINFPVDVPLTAMFTGAALKIRVPDGGEIICPS